MGALSIRFRAEPLRSLAFGSVGVGYTGIGTAVAHPIRQFLIQNYTDESLTFSFDGVDDHFVLAAGAQLINDISSNQSHSVQGWYLAQDTRFYVKQRGAAPTEGEVCLSVFYGAD